MGPLALVLDRLRPLLLPTAFAAGLLLLWQALVVIFGYPKVILPAPSDIYAALVDDFAVIWQRYTKTALFVTHSIPEAVLLADRVLVMTRRPATVVEDLEIPFARPRDVSIRDTREFNELCAYLRNKIEHSNAHASGRRAARDVVVPELVAS